ncbi:MAG: hypothetical protein D6718_10060 [Acidobacteria bacterium]|nr:MAG: hypothetical protein D6718_10060 [Acidobacteriota bacterium]
MTGALRWAAFAAGAGIVTLAASRFASWLRSEKRVATACTRKAFHFAIFSAAAAYHLAGGLPASALFGAVVSAAVLASVWRGRGDPLFEALARAEDAPHRGLFVVVPLAATAAGGLIAALLFGRYAAVGYLVAGWGDALAEPVGAWAGRHAYAVPTMTGGRATRTVEGSAAVALAGGLAAAAALAASGAPATVTLRGAVACGAAACLAEAVTPRGLDNLTVILAASAAARWAAG